MRGKSLNKDTSLGSNLASVTNLKKLKLHTFYAVSKASAASCEQEPGRTNGGANGARATNGDYYEQASHDRALWPKRKSDMRIASAVHGGRPRKRGAASRQPAAPHPERGERLRAPS